MKRDTQLQQDVMDELKWDPSVRAAIRVDVKDGVVTLSGYVDSYSKKWAAVCAAARRAGLRSVTGAGLLTHVPCCEHAGESECHASGLKYLLSLTESIAVNLLP